MTEPQHHEEEVIFKNFFVPLTTFKSISWIIIVGLIVFINISFNQFVFDDTASIVTNPSVYLFSSLPSLFLHQFTGFDTNIFYRPLPFVFYNLLYYFFQVNTFNYHLLQLFFHITNCILIFFIFKSFLKKNVSFFLALVFLVHPINEETVAYVSDLPDVLFVFFGLLAIYILQRNSQKAVAIIVANIALLLSLSSKESGALFIIFAFLHLYLFNRQKILLHTLCTFVIGSLYLTLRYFSHIQYPKIAIVPLMNLPLSERLLNIPAIIFYYIKIFIFPLNLISTNSWYIQKVTFTTFFLPAIIDCIFFAIIIWLFVSIVNKRKMALFFLLWFFFGLLIHLQIVPIDATVADRYFYFPEIGLLALLGLYIQQIKINKTLRTIFVLTAVVLLSLYSIRTIVRNSNWQDQSTIVMHDEKLTKNDYLQESLYGSAMIQQGKYQKAYPHIQKALQLYPQSYFAWNSLGVIYYKQGKVLLAKQAFQKSIELGQYYGAYENMALLLLQHDEVMTARKFIRNGTYQFANSDKLWLYRIIVEEKTGDYKDALLSAQNYYLLKRDNQSYTIYMRIQNKLPENINLQ